MGTTDAVQAPVRPARKTIELREQNETQAKKIAQACGSSIIASRILAARGFIEGKVLNDFLSPSLKEGLPDPARLKGLGAACALIRSFINRKKKIALACDFDVDGLSGGAMVFHFLQSIGVDCRVFVPDRFADGYGLNEGIVREAANEGFGLLITIDYGTTNEKELRLAASLGLKTVVIDHHHVGTSTVPADVFINPNQEGCGFADKILCASGLAWYLLIGLRQALSDVAAIDVREYLDLACLGTICDMVPLLGANRVIAHRGLQLLKDTRRCGLQALKNVAGITGAVSGHDVSFGIGPRLNAAGRMIHGEMVIDLLCTSDSLKAKKLAEELNKLNLERQDIESLMKNEAIDMLAKRGKLGGGIVVASEQFHTGVVGIVAQRLTETFYRPSVVLGIDNDGIYKGSARGIKGFNVIEALSSLAPILSKFGGHEGAGGLSLRADRLEGFTKVWEEECVRRLDGLPLEPVVLADTEILLGDVRVELINELNIFSPFGMGNPGPVLLIRNLQVVDVQQIKSTHLKAVFSDGKHYIPGILWRTKEHPAMYKGARVNVACKPDTSTFRGVTELQLTLQAVEAVVK